MSYQHLCCRGSHDHAPEKIRNLMLDEPSICEEVLQLGNIYYLFSWFDPKRKHLVCVPDGELKSIIMPVLDMPLFKEVIDGFNKKNPLLSGSNPLSYSYFPNAEIVSLNDSDIVNNISVPFVRLNCFLKHLSPLVKILVEEGLILDNQHTSNRLYRANIHDPDETTGTIIYTGDPEKGYTHFMLCLGEERK